jgi:hypothetical protein
MQMIDVMKRLAELDAGNPNIVNPMAQLAAAKHAPVTEVRTPVTEAEGNDLRVLAGVKQKKNLTESAIAECGMMPMGAPMPSTIPASINMSAGNANEIVSMMRGIMDLAKGETGFSDGPRMSHIPAMGAPMPGLGLPMGDVDRDGDHDMRDHDLEMPDSGPLMGADDDNMVSGPTFGDDDAGVDDSGADELADIMKKIKTGQPVKIKTDMPVKVTSDEPIKGTTDKLNKVSGDGPSKDEGALGAIGGGVVGAMAGGPLGALTGAAAGDQLTDTEKKETYDNTPKPKTKGFGDGNDFANIINKVRSADMTTTPANSGSNPMPDEKKKEESFANAFEAKLMAEYKKFVNESTTVEGEQKTMSRAAKGHEKYGKEGMQALAKAGREGKDLDKVRDKYNKYDESSVEEASKWRDPKYKDKLYTQEPDDGEGDRHDYYYDSRPENDPGEKRSTFNRSKDTDRLNYPYGDYQVGKKAQVGDRAKKGLLTKNAIRVVKDRIKGTSGDHPTPNLPEGMMDKVKDTVKKGAKAVDKFVTGGDKDDLIKDLQKKAGVPQTGKKPDSK